MGTFVSPPEREEPSGCVRGVWTKNNECGRKKKRVCDKKKECGQEVMSVLSTSVGVECGVWSVVCDSAVSGELPHEPQAYLTSIRIDSPLIDKPEQKDRS